LTQLAQLPENIPGHIPALNGKGRNI